MSESQYQRVRLWETEIKDKDFLNIVNPGDFPRAEILQSLGIARHSLAASLGVSDPDEVERRLGVTRFLVENPEARELLSQPLSDRLPTKGQDFLEFYDPAASHNPYWDSVRKLAGFITRGETHSALKQFAAAMMREADQLEEVELTMAADIRRRLEMTACLEGVLTFEYSGKDGLTLVKKKDQPVAGRRMFSQNLATMKEEYPRWANQKWAQKTQLWRVCQPFAMLSLAIRKHKALRSMIVDEVPQDVVMDVKVWLEEEIRRVSETSKPYGCTIVVKFTYTKDGMLVRVVDFQAPKADFLAPVEASILSFEGLSTHEHAQLECLRKEVQERLNDIGNAAAGRARWLQLLSGAPGLAHSSQISSRLTDANFRWFAIDNLYRRQYKRVVQRLEEHREFVRTHYNLLAAVSSMLESIIAVAVERKVPLCVPTVVDDGHVIAFQRLVPTQLLFRLDKKETVVPLENLPELNGRMIGLTGHHGGGKTETQLSVVVNVFLAQSGLPVFADSFEFNVKRMLAMVFIAQRGTGSTIQQLLLKIANVLEAAKRYKGSEVVVVIDEVGTGTQESSGFELGRDLLLKLNRMGVSVIFSTQITTLAEFAERELDAMCFSFDRTHQIHAGIGDGGLNDLLKTSGVGKLLQ